MKKPSDKRQQRIDFMVVVGGAPEKRESGWWYLPMDWNRRFTGPHKTFIRAIDAAMKAEGETK